MLKKLVFAGVFQVEKVVRSTSCHWIDDSKPHLHVGDDGSVVKGDVITPPSGNKNKTRPLFNSKKRCAKRKKSTKTHAKSTGDRKVFFSAWSVDGSIIFDSWNFGFEGKFRHFGRLCISFGCIGLWSITTFHSQMSLNGN